MDEVRARIIAELETYQASTSDSQPQEHISESTLLDLQKVLDNAFDSDDPEEMDRLYENLSLRNLSMDSLTRPIASAMDSGPTHLSLIASTVYLSLFLSPNAPVLTLFTPMDFLSLLRSVRRSLKHQSPPTGNDVHGKGSNSAAGRKRRGGGKGRNSRNRSSSTGGEFGSSEKENEENHLDVRVLFSVLERLEIVTGLVHLGRFPDCLKSLIQTVAEIPVTALEMCGRSPNHYTKLVASCSRILSQLLTPEHGDQATTAAEVLKSITPSILLVKSQARNFALEFVKSQMITAASGSDAIKKAVVNLPRYLVQKAPEKVEPRAAAVESIMAIVRAMAYDDQLGFVDYVVRMAQGKTHLRLLAVDILPMLLMSLREPLAGDSESVVGNSWSNSLEALMQRCSDASASIRARALSNMAQVVAFCSSDDMSQALLKKALWHDTLEDQRPRAGINDLLRKRCMDEKAAVRKAALLLITKLTALLGDAFDRDVLKLVGMACSDPLVSIRKAAISALSEALRKFSDRSIIIEWLHSVPRLISDNESSIQEECENLFLELVLNRITRAGSSRLRQNEPSSFVSNVEASSIELSFPEGVLDLLQEICNGEVMPWVRKICMSLGKKRRLKQTLAVSLQNIIKTSESHWLSHSKPIEKWTAPPGAWFLLSEVSAFLSKAVEWDFLHHHWQLFDKHDPEGEIRSPYARAGGGVEAENTEINSVAWAGDRVFLLQTISNVSVELPPEAAADLAFNLLKRLESFNMHSTEVSAHLKALRTLCKRKVLNPEEGDVLVLKWAQQLISKASRIIDMFVADNSDANKENNFLTPPSRKARRHTRLLEQAITACYTIGSLVIVCPSADLSAIVPVLHAIITSGKSFNTGPNKLPVPAILLKHTAPSLCTQAWLTMGKICLADGKLAKKYIPLFLQELERSHNAALRNNIVVMMTDFCVRYTALVDGYIQRITKCLRDPCELVRRQTFILLSRLLQRDYVKWRGVLFLRFLLSLVDESEKIRHLADYLFGTILKVKAPLLAYNSFVEAIFVLNDHHMRVAQANSRNLRNEEKLFCIRGNDEESRSKRMRIYGALLKQMAPEHLLATFAKLCADILAAATDGMLDIGDATGQSVLQDAFQILASTEIRIPTTRGPSSDAADMDEDIGDGGGGSSLSPATAAAAGATGRAISQAVRKSLIQNTIPIFIELKRLLEGRNSPLTGALMECLRILLKDYKNEIDDMLVADRQLQKELLYDIQRYETAKPRPSTAAAAAADRSVARKDGVDAAKQGAGEEADAAAEATVRSVMREASRGGATPALSSMGRPRLRASPSTGGAETREGVRSEVLRSLQRRQTFSSDEED